MHLPTTQQIAGIGVDIARVDRIARAYDRYGERFVRRILGAQEIVKFSARHARDPNRGIRFLATRFAAKEAFSKAVGLGMRSPMAWSRMQTLNEAGGKPVVVLSDPLKTWFEARFGKAHVSVTDEADTVVAFVIVESPP
ncbi:MAG: holo-ACP synthase [Burkholderiaceae bacterium]|jgi:holo-[acyl-carrier protein] synthase